MSGSLSSHCPTLFGFMSKNDFFTFITSLRPIELKAVGQLSEVLHLEEGITIYQSGDDSDALYIINRGALEVVHEDAGHGMRTPVSYLSRGDVFGETEVLSGIRRMNAIRTCESASVQRFKKKDFPELIRRVPAFFFYLSQQIASQVTKMTDLAFVQSNCLELSGNLANFDLVTIYQTILNSAQTGELAIFDDHKEAVAVFYFKEGRAKYASYYHLDGEEAFWQLFLHEKLSGTFAFSIVEANNEHELGDKIVRRNPTDLLITALQYRDEFKGLLEQVPDPSSRLRRQKLNLTWPEEADGNLRAVAENIWQVCYSSPTSIMDLFHQLDVCELKIYKAVLELLRTCHFSLVDQHSHLGVAV
jgi:CRP-like cAMP-binding protein